MFSTSVQVEVNYAKNAFYNILRNKTLEDLYAANGKALGIKFTTDEEVLRNASGERLKLKKAKLHTCHKTYQYILALT